MTTPGHSASEKVPPADRPPLGGKPGLSGYVVLAQGDDNEWRVVGNYGARSAEAAIKAQASKGLAIAGVFVAVPARSWQPVKVTPKVETTLLIEDAL